MEQLTIPLTQTSGPQVLRFRILQSFNACWFLTFAFIRGQWDLLSVVITLYGCVLLLAMAFWPIFQREYELIMDEKGIHGRVAWRKRIDLRWEQISKADLGKLNLELRTSEGKAETINLGNLTYQQHQELKPKVKHMLSRHGLAQDPKASV